MPPADLSPDTATPEAIPSKGFRQAFWKQFIALHLQNNGFSVLQRYYERHFTPVGKALLLLLMISLSLGMVGTEVLIYIFLCALAGLWSGTALIGWWSRPRKLAARVIWPAYLQAGEKMHCTLQLENHGHKPVFHLITEVMMVGPQQQRAVILPHTELFCLDRQQSIDKVFSWQPDTRGTWMISEIQFVSRFPLGLALWRQRHNQQQTVWVYPRLLELKDPPWNEQHPQMQQLTSQTTLLRGHSLEFQGIRPWLPGDSPRFIHWPSLARSGQLAVREYQESPGHQLALLLQTPASKNTEAFETAVSLMAGLVQMLSTQPLHQLLLAQIGQTLSLASNQVLSQDQLMLQLAQVSSQEVFEVQTLWKTLLQLPAPPTFIICLTTCWNPSLEQLQQQCQLHRWPLKILAVSETPAAFPASVRWIGPEFWRHP